MNTRASIHRIFLVLKTNYDNSITYWQ